MKFRNFLVLFSTLLVLNFTSCSNTSSISNNKEIVIDYINQNINYSGRIDFSSNESADLYWSGSSIKINFEGNSIDVLMQDEDSLNYYNLILDRDSIIIFHPSKEKKYYSLLSGLEKGKHSLEIFRRTEWSKGKTSFFGFKIKGDAKVLPQDKAKKHRIEFYGDSITAGYANEDPLGKDNPDTTNTNNYMSYAAITARNFDAEYSCIAKGGIGIMISWFDFTMPDIYDRLVPNDKNSKWEFLLYTPEIVVVNLFQNDSWLVNMSDRKEFKEKFGDKAPSDEFIVDAYKNFIQSIRNKYPEANIICALGNMDATRDGSLWPSYIDSAVEKLNDKKIKTCFFPFKNTKGHPSIAEHKKMAKTLTSFISENYNW